MAFPTVNTTAVSAALSGTAQVMPMPTHAAGDRLVVIHAVDGGASNYVSHTAGWTLLANTSSGTTCFLLVFEKEAASSSEALTVTLSGSRTARAVSYAIQGHDSTQAAEIATASGTSTTPDPPSLSPSWGSDDNLWIVALSQDNSTIGLSSFPSGYTANQLNNPGGTTATPRAAAATQEVATGTENPGAFTLAATEQWVTATIAIKPAGGGGGTTYTITPSGGVTFSGDVLAVRERRQVVSGGVVFSGAVIARRERVFIAGGQVTFSGTAPITFNGSASYTIIPSGGFVLSGAPVQIHERQMIPAGGVVFSGAAAQIHEQVIAPAGQVTFLGSAPITFIPAGGIPFSPVSRITVGSARANRIS